MSFSPNQVEDRLRSVWALVPENAAGGHWFLASHRRQAIGRILPIEVVRIDADAYVQRKQANKHILILAAGAFLARVGSTTIPTYCTWNHGRGTRRVFALDATADVLCFRDNDNNGRFDAYFPKYSLQAQLFAFQHTKVDGEKNLDQEVGFKPTESTEYPANILFIVMYSPPSGPEDFHRISIGLSNEYGYLPLYPSIQIPASTREEDINIGGVPMHVRLSAEARAEIELRSAEPTIPLTILKPS